MSHVVTTLPRPRRAFLTTIQSAFVSLGGIPLAQIFLRLKGGYVEIFWVDFHVL